MNDRGCLKTMTWILGTRALLNSGQLDKKAYFELEQTGRQQKIL